MDTTAEPDDIIKQLLISILDEKTELIKAHLPKIITEIINQPNWSVTKGVSSFIQEISDMAVDSLELPVWFYHLVLWPLIDSKKVALKDIEWLHAEEDDIYSLGGHFKLLAQLICHRAKMAGNYANAISELKPVIGGVVEQMIKKCEQDDSVVDIEELKADICKETDLTEPNEVFKFLGLSQ